MNKIQQKILFQRQNKLPIYNEIKNNMFLFIHKQCSIVHFFHANNKSKLRLIRNNIIKVIFILIKMHPLKAKETHSE